MAEMAKKASFFVGKLMAQRINLIGGGHQFDRGSASI